MSDRPRILIVDDTPLNIKILADLLRSDYTLSVATSGAGALEVANSEDRPDLVLLDVMMPEMDGYEVCRRLKANAKTREIPIIFVTAMSETEDETKGFELGAVDYITKPVRPPIVQARVAAQLELAMNRKMLAAQNQSMRESLRVAADVQRGLLPKAAPIIPGLDIGGCAIPCDAVGGDYMDYLLNGESGGRGVGVVVGDVSGHGPGSALLMTAARAFLRMRISQPGTLSEVISELNCRLAADVCGSWRFMTMFLLTLDGEKLTWTRAGHDPTLLVDPARQTIEELLGEGTPLGLYPDSAFEQCSATFAGRDRLLVLTTDGIPETFGPDGEQYGQERYRAALLRNAHLSAQQVVDNVIADVLKFRGDAPQTDDVTMVVVKRTA